MGETLAASSAGEVLVRASRCKSSDDTNDMARMCSPLSCCTERQRARVAKRREGRQQLVLG